MKTFLISTGVVLGLLAIVGGIVGKWAMGKARSATDLGIAVRVEKPLPG